MAYQFETSGRLKMPSPEELAAADADSAVIVLDHGMMDDGRPYWVYIAVKPSKYQEFMEFTRARQPIRFKDYGEILEYGFEKEVPAAIRAKMKREHDCDENYLARITEEIKAAQAMFLKQREEQRLNDIVAMLKKKRPNGAA